MQDGRAALEGEQPGWIGGVATADELEAGGAGPFPQVREIERPQVPLDLGLSLARQGSDQLAVGQREHLGDLLSGFVEMAAETLNQP